MLVPLMSSRLMLSLKEAAAEPTEPFSLATITDLTSGGSSADGSQGIRFKSPAVDVSHGTSEIPPSPKEEDIELDSMSRHRKTDIEMMGSCP